VHLVGFIMKIRRYFQVTSLKFKVNSPMKYQDLSPNIVSFLRWW